MQNPLNSLTQQEVERLKSFSQALCILKVYPLSPAVLMSILTADAPPFYVSQIANILCEVLKLDEKELIDEYIAIIKFAEDNLGDLVNEVSGDIRGRGNTVMATVNSANECTVCHKKIPPGKFQLTCSDECHEKLIESSEKEFGKYKKIISLTDNVARKVPTRTIIEKGIKGFELDQFPIWNDED